MTLANEQLKTPITVDLVVGMIQSLGKTGQVELPDDLAQECLLWQKYGYNPVTMWIEQALNDRKTLTTDAEVAAAMQRIEQTINEVGLGEDVINPNIVVWPRQQPKKTNLTGKPVIYAGIW